VRVRAEGSEWQMCDRMRGSSGYEMRLTGWGKGSGMIPTTEQIFTYGRLGVGRKDNLVDPQTGTLHPG
jgi:hypothetical protein